MSASAGMGEPIASRCMPRPWALTVHAGEPAVAAATGMRSRDRCGAVHSPRRHRSRGPRRDRPSRLHRRRTASRTTRPTTANSDRSCHPTPRTDPAPGGLPRVRSFGPAPWSRRSSTDSLVYMADNQRRRTSLLVRLPPATALVGPSAWRDAAKGSVLLPVALARLVAGVWTRQGPLVLRGGCGLALGLFGLAVTFLAGQATGNGLLYPLVDDHDYQHSWGGPTLLGAWAVHALLAVPVVLVALGALRGVTLADRALIREVPGERGPWWPIPLAGALGLLAVLLVNAWLHQL